MKILNNKKGLQNSINFGKKIFFVLSLIIVLLAVSCEKEDNTQIANPASVYCIEQGGELRITDNEQGQYGLCVFEDGSECEEWDFFRGECDRSSIAQEDKYFCETDIDCVPEQCCHADSCINEKFKPDCEGLMCTLECKPETLDCGQGNCVCENNRCTAKII
jgi:putative hemolysin